MKQLAILGIVFAAPRLFRLLYPSLWVEDPNWSYAAYLVSEGYTPYHDFHFPHTVLLEYLLGAFYHVLGSSYRVAEVLSQCMVYATTWLIWDCGRKIGRESIGIAAALTLACSSLLFRYHVWEREIPLLLILTLVVWLLLRWKTALISRQKLVLACLLGLTIAFKLTAVLQLAATMGYLIVVRRDWRGAMQVGGGAGVFALVILSPFYAHDPVNFFNQTLLFHLVKGATFATSLGSLLMPARVLDVSLVLGLLGTFFWTRNHFTDLALALTIAVVDLFFFSFFSPTAWPHNYVPALILLSLSAGLFFDGLLGLWQTRRLRWRPLLWLVAAGGLLVWPISIVNLNWTMGSHYGFGYLPRASVSQTAAFLHKTTKRNDLLLVPQYLAAQAGRFTLMPDLIEGAGIFRWIESLQRQGLGYRAILSRASGQSFGRMKEQTLPMAWDAIKATLQQRRIHTVILDVVPGEEIPFSASQLRNWGYVPVQQFGPFTIWR